MMGVSRGKNISESIRKAVRLGILFVCLSLAVFCYPIYNLKASSVSGGNEGDLAVDPLHSDGYSTVLYDNTNGLPTSEANAIVETEEGFIWIGSYSGLIKYDGNTFERIDSTTGITSVVSLFVDSKNRLWIGTNDNGVAVMDKGDVTFYNHIEGMKSSSVRAIAEDRDGNIFIGTTDGLGMIDTDMEFHVINEPQVNGEFVHELKANDSGTIYGNTLSGAVFVIRDRKVVNYYDAEKTGAGTITTVTPDNDHPGFLYMGNERSELFYGVLGDESSIKEIDVSPLEGINRLEMYQDQVWICAYNGIGLYGDGNFNTIENVPMNNSVDDILADYEGNMWFTSSRQGVMKIVPNKFMDINERYGLDKMVVNSTCVTDDMLFMGTDEGLVVVDNEKKVDKIPVDKVVSSNNDLKDYDDFIELMGTSRIRSIIKDSQGRMWLSTYSELGLVMYDHGSVYTFNSEDGMPSDRIRVVTEREDGSIMAACSGGVAFIKNNKITEVLNEKSGLANSEILTICNGDDGKIYLGSDGDGIYVIEGSNIRNIGVDEGLSSAVVLRIKRDAKRGIYWVITSNGIAYMKDDKITNIQKFPYSNNFDLYENKNDKMWILSSNGIYVIGVDELLENGDEIAPVYYNMDNGLQYIATANSYSYLAENGNLYISGGAGVSRVNIDEPLENIDELKIAVPYVDVDGKLIYADDDGRINIPASTKRLTIYPYVYTYSLINPEVSYYLKGFDKDVMTVDRTDLEPAVYTNLEGGTYKFVMNLHTSLGEGDRKYEVTISKKKAIYEKLWFRLLFGAIGLGFIAMMVVYYVRRKTRALVKKQQENKIFIREMIEAFAKTIDMKDKYTNGHSTRVAEYTAMLTKELGYDEETIEKYYNIALLHDIGKIGIPPEVLNKPGKLTDQEFNIIKSHSAQGYKVLKDISIMPELAIGAGAHHERPDGKGYPRGLKGDEIPRVAQIIAVADTFDAMYSDRPYRKRMNFDKAVSIIKEVSGTQLETDVVDAFLRLVDKGEFKAPDDHGGGSTEDINNIHKKFDGKKDNTNISDGENQTKNNEGEQKEE